MTAASARLRLVDVASGLGGGPLFGAATRAGREAAAARTKLKVTGPDGLDWTVKRLLLPLGMRPHRRSEVVELSHLSHEVGAPLPLGFVVLLLTLPFLPLVLLLRTLRVLPWTLEARTYPWERRYGPVVLAYEVRGREEAETALADLAAGLARGEGAPVVRDAERIS